MWSALAPPRVSSPRATPARSGRWPPRCGRERHGGRRRAAPRPPRCRSSRCRRPDDHGPHVVEEPGQIGDLGLTGRVVDDGRPLGQHRGHECVLRRTDARELQHDRRAVQPVGRAPRCSRARTRSWRPAARAPGRACRSGGDRNRPRRAGPPGPARSVTTVGRARRCWPASSRPVRRGPRDSGRRLSMTRVAHPLHDHAHRLEQIPHPPDIGDAGDVAAASRGPRPARSRPSASAPSSWPH